jgi:hypothetical protein
VSEICEIGEQGVSTVGSEQLVVQLLRTLASSVVALLCCEIASRLVVDQARKLLNAIVDSSTHLMNSTTGKVAFIGC